MTPRRRALLVLTVHLVLVLLVAGKYAVDRATLPRVWARSVPIDPDDPLRGRYVRIWLEAHDQTEGHSRVRLVVRGDSLIARGEESPAGLAWRAAPAADPARVVVSEPLAYFIAEAAEDPSRLGPGEELWVLVSVPEQGLPRPLQVERRHRP